MSDEGLKRIDDIISEMLNDPKSPIKPRHVHVFRKEYDKCLIRGCDAPKNPSTHFESSA
jgi:hypothetical protein